MATSDILNDDCLLLIFEHFDIYELMELECVSEQFKRCAEQKYRTYKSITIELRFTDVNKMEDLFKRIGKHLNAFQYSGGYLVDVYNSKVLQPMTEYCTQLTELRLHYIRFIPYVDDILRKIVPNLITLSIGHCILTQEFEEILKKYGQNLRNIYLFGRADIPIETLLIFTTALERVEWILKRVDECETYRLLVLNNKNLIYLKITIFSCFPISLEIKFRELIEELRPNIEFVIDRLPYPYID